MNTAKLSKHYESLTAAERVPLIIAACARGDATERARLETSAPVLRFQTGHHYSLSIRWQQLAQRYVARQLELAAQIFHGLTLGAATDEIPDFVRVAAYWFVVNHDAWSQFCAGFGITPDAVLAETPGADTINSAEPRIRFLACTTDKATAWLQQQRGDGAEAPTVAATADAMRQLVTD